VIGEDRPVVVLDGEGCSVDAGCTTGVAQLADQEKAAGAKGGEEATETGVWWELGMLREASKMEVIEVPTGKRTMSGSNVGVVLELVRKDAHSGPCSRCRQ
jgi:hypothetical protein